jgi:hypothetical protein
VDENKARAELERFLEHVEREVSGLIPQGGEGLSDEHFLVWAMVAHVVRMFRAIRSLLSKGLAFEASGLNRTLLQTAGQLAYFMHNQERLEELRLRLLFDSLAELERLAKFEGDLELPFAEEAIAYTQGQRSELTNAFVDRGIPPGGLPDPRQMLKEMEKEERYWYFKRASSDVHGDVVALGAKMKQNERGGYVAALEDDYKTILVVAMAAADHFVSSLIAAANILAWDQAEAIREFRSSMDETLMDLGRAAGLRGLPEQSGAGDK